MPRATELRVGRCGCIAHPGRLLPEYITVAYRGGKKRRGRLRRRKFIIQEIPIPEDKDAETSYLNRIHVFLDMHPQGDGRYKTFLEIGDIVPATGGRPPRRFTYRGGDEYAVPKMWWESEGPIPSMEALAGGLMHLLQRWNRRVPFRVWLSRMTPKGWCLPGG